MRVQPRYHPFFHEVAAAEPDSALGDAVLVEEEIWPGLWFGDLIFARAGVRVRGGPGASCDAARAARSTLYFAWTRVHRPTCDLSHGWGSSSQWATRFRRDYADGAVLRYNVDGRVLLTDDAIVPPQPPDDRSDDTALCGDLTPAERIELLTQRCFVHTAKPDKGPLALRRHLCRTGSRIGLDAVAVFATPTTMVIGRILRPVRAIWLIASGPARPARARPPARPRRRPPRGRAGRCRPVPRGTAGALRPRTPGAAHRG